MTRLLCLPWLVCRSVSYYTNLHDWIIKWFQTRWQKCPAFKTCKKCGRPDFPSQLCRSWKSLAVSKLASNGGSATKQVPQAPESHQLRRLHREFLYELTGPTVGHLHLFLKKLIDKCPTIAQQGEWACLHVQRGIKRAIPRKLVKISDCRVSSFLKTVPGCRVSRHGGVLLKYVQQC